MDICFATVGLLSFNNIDTSIETIFQGCLLGFSLLTNAFFFNEGVLFNSHLTSNIIPCSDLSIYGLFAMTIYFIEKPRYGNALIY